MIVTTTPTIDGYRITGYYGIVFGEVITGINFLKDFGAGIRNLVGGRSAGYEEELMVARNQALEELQPLTMDQHFGYIAQVQPDLYKTKPSEVAFCVASNPLKNWCNHDYQAKVLESFDWIFGMDIYLNDSSYYYDLVIPEPSYLERFDPLPLSFNNHRVPGCPEVPYIVAGRMPIVDARDACPSALDTFGALAAKAGKTAEYSGALNDYYRLADKYKLDGTEQITAERVCDAALKSLAGGERGVEWFRENGVWTRDRKADEVYVFAAGQPGRIPLYFDFMFEAKEKVEAEVAKLGIPWETDDYMPLPEWKPCVDHEIEDPDFDMFPVYWTNAINTDTWQVQTPGSTRSTSWTRTPTSWRSTPRPQRPRASPRATRCACRTATVMSWRAWPW